MDPGRFIDLAVRLPAYAGVVAARARAEESDGGQNIGLDEDRTVDPSSLSLSTDPVLSQFFDVEVIE